MSSFDTATEEKIEAEVVKRTAFRGLFLLVVTIACGCAAIFYFYQSYALWKERTEFRKEQLLAITAQQHIDQKNQEVAELRWIQERENKIEKLVQMIETATEEVEVQSARLTVRRDELKKAHVHLTHTRSSLF